MRIEHMKKLKTLLATNQTTVPIVVQGEKFVYIRPQGLILLDRIQLQDVRNAPGDRIEMLLDGVLPLPGLGAWPHKTMQEVYRLVSEANEDGR